MTSLADAARDAVRAALVASGGRVRVAAVPLGISPSALHRKIRRLGLRPWLTATYSRSARQRLE